MQFDLRGIEEESWHRGSARRRFYTGIVLAILMPVSLVAILAAHPTPLLSPVLLPVYAFYTVLEATFVLAIPAYRRGPIAASLSGSVLELTFISGASRRYDFTDPRLHLVLRA
ncbi:MAG TPA: hypothetical protein VMG36_00040, partial [Thermoplasmata archaeon]|nr:hypothetical protein [Thermoplasmata archaeon]